MPPRQTGAAPCSGTLWGAQWGLKFETQNSGTDVDALEGAYWATRNAAHQATAAVLTAGVALVHGLLALKLHSQGQTGLAAAAATTTGQQVLVWLMAVLSPAVFSRLRPLLYALSVTFPAMHATSLFATSNTVVNCSSPQGASFWVSQLLASGVPWLVVHAVLFPLTVTQGILVHGVATVLLLSSNRTRCAAALEQCPASGPLLQRVAHTLQRLTVFSSSRGCSPWFGCAQPGLAAGVNNSGATGVAASAAQQQHLYSCMAVYSTFQLAMGYLAVLQLAWWLERAARLAFLRRTEEVEAEWRLERKQRPPGVLLLEMAAMLLVAWQIVDMGMSLLTPTAAAAAPAPGSSDGAMH